MIRFDLHIHTALSACAENILSPRQIVARAVTAGLTHIGITDHNASANTETAWRLGRAAGLLVLPGMELSSREEAHVLVYFKNPADLAVFQVEVDRHLPQEPNMPDIFGDQLIYDADDSIIDIDERLRQVGTSLSIQEIVTQVHARGGVVIPAHAYRHRFSLWSQLGFIDAGAGFDALEVSATQWRQKGYRPGDDVEGYPVLAGSDAHFLEDIGRFYLETEGEAGDDPKSFVATVTTRRQV